MRQPTLPTNTVPTPRYGTRSIYGAIKASILGAFFAGIVGKHKADAMNLAPVNRPMLGVDVPTQVRITTKY
jgi:hypothetical protein